MHPHIPINVLKSPSKVHAHLNNSLKHIPLCSPHAAALFYRLKQRGFQECDDKAKLYAGI